MRFTGILLGSQLLLAALAAPTAIVEAGLTARSVEFSAASKRSIGGIEDAKRGLETMLQTLAIRNEMGTDTDEDASQGICSKRALDALEIAKRELESMGPR